MLELSQPRSTGPIDVRGERGYIDPASGEPTQYKELNARVKTILEFYSAHSSTKSPQAKELLNRARNEFSKNARSVVARRNRRERN